MDDWKFLDWVAYGSIAIAALMPALGLAVSTEPNLRIKAKPILESRWWKIVPGIALLISAIIVGANQLGFIDHSPQKIAARTALSGGRAALVTGNGSSADSNYLFGTDRPIVSGDNTHATGNTVVVAPASPNLLQQLQNQQKVVLQEILQRYFAEHPDANRQRAVPVDYINSELKKRNLDWYVTIPLGVGYTVHSPQNQNESAIFTR